MRRRRTRRVRSAYRPYQGRRGGRNWILLAVVIVILLALAVWLWRDMLLGLLPLKRAPLP